MLPTSTSTIIFLPKQVSFFPTISSIQLMIKESRISPQDVWGREITTSLIITLVLILITPSPILVTELR
jgi:hypothetical protein